MDSTSRQLSQVLTRKRSRRPGLSVVRSAPSRLLLAVVLGASLTVAVGPSGSHGSGVVGASSATAASPASQTIISTQSVNLNDGLPASQVAVGRRVSCALSNGSVYCWGSTFFGALGNGDAVGISDTKSFPVKVLEASGFTNSNVTAIAAGGATVCALEGGSMYCWGDNRYGALGNNTTVSSSTPVKVGNNGSFVNDNIVRMAVSNEHICAVRNNHLYCWGRNNDGRLGFTTPDQKCENAPNSPEKCEILPALAGSNATFLNDGAVPITGVALTQSGVCAIVNEVILCWGYNVAGELGIAGMGNNATIAAIPAGEIAGGNTGVTSLTAAGSNACAIKNQVVYCWGNNDHGALGDDTATSSHEPLKVVSTSDFSNATVSAVAVNNLGTSSGSTACAIENGHLFCWGLGIDTGQSILTQSASDAGCNDQHFCRVPVKALDGEMGNTGLSSGSGAIAVSSEHACAVKSSTVFCWGSGSDGQLGLAGVFLPPRGNFTDPNRIGDPETPWMVYNTAQPSVSAITPITFGPGDTVTLSGTGLQSSTRVFIGFRLNDPVSNVCGSVTVNGAGTELTCTFGAVETLTTNLVVQNPRELNAFGGQSGPAPAYTWTGRRAGGSSGPNMNPGPFNPGPVVGPTVVSPPSAGAVPSLVSVEDAAGLQRAPGVGGVVVGGVPVRAEVRRVDVPAVAVAPEDRTPEQVVAVQEAAASLVESFVAAAPAGSDPLVTVTNTDTGAVVNGVLVDPRDGVTPVPVPAEDVVLLEAVDTRVLFAAASGDAVPAGATGAVLEVSEGGVISAVAYGFPAAVPGEVVIFSTPTLLGSFTIGTDGSFAGQMEIPEGLEPGEHTLVLTAGGVTTSLGLKVAGDGSAVLTPVPISETLPATGSSHDPAVWILLVALGGLMVLISRRRYV